MRRRGPPYLWALVVLILVCGGLGWLGPGRELERDEARAADPEALPSLLPSLHAGRVIRMVLGRQSAALIRGDERGWLRDVDPAIAGEMRRLYANLRGLLVSGWVTEPAGPAAGRAGGVWHADVRIRVCFAGPTCVPGDATAPSVDLLTAGTSWQVTGDRAVLTGFSLDGDNGSGRPLPNRPTPWERGTLTFAAGRRVVVAAPRGRLRPGSWLAAAERAAAAADRYTLADPRVGAYLVFLAGRREWPTWFAASRDRDVLGYALRPSETSAFIVIDTTKVKADARGEIVLRHEMAHIATRYGPSTRVDEWATEGIAEYVAWAGRPVSAYDRTGDTRALVTRIEWRRELDLEWSHVPARRSGYYGMGFFAMRCLSETYGEARMLDFFDRLAHRGRGPAQAAGEAFGVTWAAAQRGCAPRIRAWLRD